MFLISSNNPQKVLKVVEDIDTIENFIHLDLGEINSLELIELVPESSKWAQGEPLIFDEVSGIVLLNYSTAAVKWLKNNSASLTKYGISEESIDAFCSSNIDQLFCLDTF